MKRHKYTVILERGEDIRRTYVMANNDVEALLLAENLNKNWHVKDAFQEGNDWHRVAQDEVDEIMERENEL